METELTILDGDDALVITSTRKPSLAEVTLSAVAVGGFIAVLAFSFLNEPMVVAVSISAALLTFMYAARKKKVELRITKLEFVSRGRIGDNLGLRRTVCSADIRWLEYQEDTIGPETSHHPGGLYAVLGHRSTCLLPNVSEAQTALIIDRIKERFPDFRTRWEGQSPFGKHFTSLGLNEPK